MSDTPIRRVILDCDPGNGVPVTDIDDGLALGFLLEAEGIELELVTIVTGNTHRDTGYRVARTMLDDVGVDVPVCLGAATALLEPQDPWTDRRERARRDAKSAPFWQGVAPPRDYPLPEKADAAAEIAARVAAAPGKITIAAVGPLTNIAHALSLHPGLAEDVAEIIVMGGAFDVPGYFQELNFGVDPEAARQVIASGAPVTLVPLDVTIRTALRLRDVERLGTAGTKLASYLAKTTEPWVRHVERARGREGCALHDPLAAALLVDRGIARIERCTVDVELTGLTRARPLRWDADAVRLATGVDVPRHRPIDVVTDVDNDALVELLLRTLGA
ncbi:nucleoside hydrolase [Ruania albidiflava]|uniref:nucleoside hydrolase n=1 Tax=Ruania albidiflava TaxID=366586 RepID=UPI0003B78FAE|nr:nucleoside hydrolase [Ruania albidiflava]